MTNETYIKLNLKAMRPRMILILVTLLLFASGYTEAKNMKAISENDTILIIVNRNLVDLFEDQSDNCGKENNFLTALPDTTKDIIIIIRTIYQETPQLNAENKNSIDRMNFWQIAWVDNRNSIVSNIFKG